MNSSERIIQGRQGLNGAQIIVNRTGFLGGPIP